MWRGDFETGNRSQYTGAQMVSADRLQVVTSPVAEGKYALKATVVQGDDPINGSGNRNELVYQGNEAVGSEYYYRWKVMFAPDFPSVKTWQLFTQWHHDGLSGSPPVQFLVYGEEVQLSINDSVTAWTAPLVRGVWHEFIFHVKWSSDPKVGFIELWYDGKPVVAKRSIGTMYSGMKNYLKLGLYRNDTVAQVGVVYHDGFIQATTLEDVMPLQSGPVEPGTDAGTPTPSTDAGTPSPSTDAGTPTPTADAGTPAPTVDAGTPVEPGSTSTDTPSTPIVTTPPSANGTPEPSADEAAKVGCSAAGGPLAVLGLLSLVGAARRVRRRRR